MDYNKLREDLENYVKKTGARYRFIARSCNISEGYLSRWRRNCKDTKEMNEESYQRLRDFLDERM